MPARHSRTSSSSQSKPARGSMSGAASRSKRSAKPSAQISSVRVGDIGKGGAQRARSRKAWALRGLAAIVVLAALLGAALYVYTSDALRIDEVRVEGVRHLTADEMTQLAAVPASSTLLRVDEGAILERLRSSPWVEDASLHRLFPHTLQIDIVERAIAAVVEVTSVEKQTVDSWAISKDGIWLLLIPPEGTEESLQTSAQIYEDAASVLHITEVPLDVRPEVGAFCNDESVLNALAIVSGFSTSLANRVSVVSATDAANTLLTLDNGIQIAFGTAENLRDKERVCLELMEKYPDQIAYINVRVVERPTWRAVGSW